MDEQIIESTAAPSAEEAEEFSNELSDLAAKARAQRAGNPALHRTMQHQYPGAPFGSVNDPGFEKYK